MEFEEQSGAVRQMKELLRDQAKFRAKLDRVVRRIETSSQRTARLTERNKTRKQPVVKNGPKRLDHGTDGNGTGNGNGADIHADGEGNESGMELAEATSAPAVL